MATLEIPEPLDSPDFAEKWEEWLKYRRSRRLPKYATNRVLLMLARFGKDTAIKAIDQSITQNWQGLFPERFGNESATRGQRHLQSGGRAQPPKGKYDALDEGTPEPPGEDGPGHQGPP